MNVSGQRDPQQKALEIGQRRDRVIELREQGLTFREISAKMGVSLGLVHKDFEAGIDRILEPNVAKYRANHVARLSKMREVAQDVIDRRHAVISQAGKIVYDEDGNPVEDDMIVLAAMDRVSKIDESERKLLGLDIKPDLQITGALLYTIVGLDSDATRPDD
jgi:hypothetical protein